MAMAQPYRVYGAELSPYSVKVRSYLRYKGIAHEWIVRTPAVQAEFDRYAKLPLIPLVVTPDDRGLQDSTPILETLEAKFSEPSIHPADEALAFISALLEEFGDEWGNKWMFHYRWWRDEDQESAAARIAEMLSPPGATEAKKRGIANAIRERMRERLDFVGSSERNRSLIERSFCAAVEILERHLASRRYLFGSRPAFADFGLWGQLYCASTDPTCGRILRQNASALLCWVERMLEPRLEGEFEPWASLEPTLAPLLERQVGGLFLPWSDANARALAAGAKAFRVELDGRTWEQGVYKYHAVSLAALRERYREISDRAELDAILARCGCLPWLRVR
jgi:glutathione S-transferase